MDDLFLRALCQLPRCVLQEQLDKLLEEQLSGKSIISHSFEGNGVTFSRTATPKELIGYIQAALECKDAEEGGYPQRQAPRNIMVDFRSRYVGS